ncbi:hypothetical protein HY990_06425 [Candidatus Micrarchaeota archaeon]|nr:hypothetical protein [Candidatus Micrarchaeota archaeon]
MFGTSGIRGIFDKDITLDLAYRIGNIFANGKMTIARDIRESGPALLESTNAGANENGSDIIDLGIVPTPTAALSSKKYNCRSIMLTASHNPPEYNGLKLIERGKEIDKKMEKWVEAQYKQNVVKRNERKGQKFVDNQIIQDHKDLIFDLIDTKVIARKKPKIVVDCNGAAGSITPSLLSDLGARVVSLNASLDGFCRPSEPNDANVGMLKAAVRNSGADFGIAHDGDGDRCIVVDELGEALAFDVQLALMIEHEMDESREKRIVSTVESSLLIREVVESKGGKVEITPVGSTFIGDLMEHNGAIFGGEPCGEYVYRKGVHVPDAVLAAAKFAQIFCQRGQFSKLKTRYKQNFIAREKFASKDKYEAINRIKGEIQIEGERRNDDGIRIDEQDGWFLIRASGTEPIVRLTMEYKTKEKLERRLIELAKLIRQNH